MEGAVEGVGAGEWLGTGTEAVVGLGAGVWESGASAVAGVGAGVGVWLRIGVGQGEEDTFWCKILPRPCKRCVDV